MVLKVVSILCCGDGFLYFFDFIAFVAFWAKRDEKWSRSRSDIKFVSVGGPGIRNEQIRNQQFIDMR